MAFQKKHWLQDWCDNSDYDRLSDMDWKRVQVPGDNDNRGGIQDVILRGI